MNVVIIGCGVVGAAIAYELSQVKGLNITGFTGTLPALGNIPVGNFGSWFVLCNGWGL